MKELKKCILFFTIFYPLISICQTTDTALYEASYFLTIKDLENGRITNDSLIVKGGTSMSVCYSEWNRQSLLLIQKKYIDMPDASSRNIDLRGFPKSKYGFTPKIYKNFIKKEIVVTDQLVNDKYYYEDSLDLFNWKILPDTSLINGYSCQRAETDFRGRHYIAWFSSEIPLDIGPMKFGRLPGIIVKVGDNTGRYSFELYSFQRVLNENTIEFATNGLLHTDRKKISELRKVMYENPVAFINAQGSGQVTINGGNSNPKRKYNPLELE